jgi:hypothetical protein
MNFKGFEIKKQGWFVVALMKVLARKQLRKMRRTSVTRDAPRKVPSTEVNGLYFGGRVKQWRVNKWESGKHFRPAALPLPVKQTCSSLLQKSRPPLVYTLPPVQWLQGVRSSGVKRPVYEDWRRQGYEWVEIYLHSPKCISSMLSNFTYFTWRNSPTEA